MELEGTVVNGVIVLDGGANLPDGSRVRVEVTDCDDLVPPTEPYDRERELAILRESLADVAAGRGVPFEEFMAAVAAENKLPTVPAE